MHVLEYCLCITHCTRTHTFTSYVAPRVIVVLFLPFRQSVNNISFIFYIFSVIIFIYKIIESASAWQLNQKNPTLSETSRLFNILLLVVELSGTLVEWSFEVIDILVLFFVWSHYIFCLPPLLLLHSVLYLLLETTNLLPWYMQSH